MRHRIKVTRDYAGHYTWICGPFKGYCYNGSGRDGRKWNGVSDNKWGGTASAFDTAIEAFWRYDAFKSLTEYKWHVEKVVEKWVRECE